MMHDDYEGLGMSLLDRHRQRVLAKAQLAPVAPTRTGTIVDAARRTTARLVQLATAAQQRAESGGYQPVPQVATYPAMFEMPTPTIQRIPGEPKFRGDLPQPEVPAAAPSPGFTFQPWMLAAAAIPLLLMRR